MEARGGGKEEKKGRERKKRERWTSVLPIYGEHKKRREKRKKGRGLGKNEGVEEGTNTRISCG